MRWRGWPVPAATVLLLIAVPALAQTPSTPAPVAPPAPGDEAVKLHGFVSASFVYNQNRPASRTNALRVFDVATDSLVLDVAQFVAERSVSVEHRAGFKIALAAGSSIPKVSAASGLFRDPVTGRAQDIDLQQAYASVMLSRRLRLDAGKFVTPLGFEVIEGWDSANDHASRSLLFGYAIPFTHTGLRMSASGSKVSALVMVANGWDNAIDNNRGKTIAGQVSFAPGRGMSVAATAISGPEQTANNRNLRTVYDLVWTWKLSSLTSLSLNADDGRETGATSEGGAAQWRGVAGYARLGMTPRLALCVRGEIFDDRQGVRTGVAQRVAEVTLTPEVKLSALALIRVDVRVDRSNQRVFESRSGPMHTQPTVQFNFICLF